MFSIFSMLREISNYQLAHILRHIFSVKRPVDLTVVAKDSDQNTEYWPILLKLGVLLLQNLTHVYQSAQTLISSYNDCTQFQNRGPMAMSWHLRERLLDWVAAWRWASGWTIWI